MLFSTLPGFLAAGLLSITAVVAMPNGDWHHMPTMDYQCSPAVVALAAGIQLNIIAQHGAFLMLHITSNTLAYLRRRT